MSLEVINLSIYPLKSAKGIKLDSMQLGDRGPNLDRRWMLVGQNGKFVTQRKHPKLCLITTKLVGEELVLSKPNAEPILIPAPSSRQYTSEVWGSAVSGHDCGDQVANYIGEFLGLECRLIFMPETYERRVDPDFARNNELVGFADGFPVLLASQASLDDFNQRLGYEIGMERFRPNLVIGGCEPYAEDGWQRLSIAGIEFSLVKPCSRCIMPSVNPATGEKEMRVNQTLMQYRRRDRKTYFGQNALYNRSGTIKVGDKVTIVSD